MKRRFDLLTGVLAASGLAVLILDGRVAIVGAREGLQLCLNTLVPTLFPFFFLSNILTAGLMGRKIPLLRPLGRICKLPEGAEYILIAGFLGGYPLGAQCISQACESGSLSNLDGRRMLAFCNNCGPAFVFGVCGTLFQDSNIPWLLFSIQILSAIAVAVILPGKPRHCGVILGRKPSAVQALRRALLSMAGVCGWVVLFRTALAVLERWFGWYISATGNVIINGILELSNGCIGLYSIERSQLRFILCAGFLTFGGLCVTMQTYSAATGVDRSMYFPGKVLQTDISLTLACLLCEPKWAVLPGGIAALMGIFLQKREIRCRNPQKVVV